MAEQIFAYLIGTAAVIKATAELITAVSKAQKARKPKRKKK